MSSIRDQIGDLTEFTPGNAVAAARLEREIERLRGDYKFQKAKADRLVELNGALEKVVAVAAEECSRQGCHCPGEIKGKCSYCRIGAAIAGLRLNQNPKDQP